MFFTEKEARTKRAFADCGKPVKVNVLTKGGSHAGTEERRRCIASRCIAWVWEENPMEHYALPNGAEERRWIVAPPFASRYKKDEADKPDGATEFLLAYPLMQHSDPHRDVGWWVRPNQNRLGRCGRVIVSTLLEQN